MLEIVRQVDEHFPTIADRSHRAIAGLSMGGYGALNIDCITFDLRDHRELVGYFHEDRAGPFSSATPANLRYNSPAAYAPSLAAQHPSPAGARLPLQRGPGPLTHNQVPFAQELRRRGRGPHRRAPATRLAAVARSRCPPPSAMPGTGCTRP